MMRSGQSVAKRLLHALVGVVLLLTTLPSFASTCGAGYETYTDAMTACQAFDTRNSSPPYNNPKGTCSNRPFSPGPGGFVHWSSSTGDGGGYADFGYCSGGPSDQCKARPPLNQAFDGVNTTVVNAGCKYSLKSDDDKAVKVCVVWNGKQVCTGSATWVPTGEFVGTPATNPDPAPAAPKVCNGGSCFDPAGNQYCASTGSGQVCVPATNGSTTGGCSSNGGTTLCAGSPPPTPPNPPIADPASQIASSDKYSSQTGTGPISSVTVNNFNNTGTGAKNGAGSGDAGAPASGSSSGTPSQGDGTTSMGGGDCNTPPIVQGSGGMSAIAYQTWRTRCALEGSNGAGDGSSVGKLYTPSTDTTQSVVADFQAKVQAAPIANAATGFFSVGGTGGACPTWTLAATDWNPALTFDFYCRPEADAALDLAKAVLIILCAYCAWVIAMGDS
jgi:hypothetical protein